MILARVVHIDKQNVVSVKIGLHDKVIDSRLYILTKPYTDLKKNDMIGITRGSISPYVIRIEE